MLPEEIPSSFAYALLKPDVIIRGILADVLATLHIIGFDVINFCSGVLSDQLFNEMYGGTFQWRLDDWSHNREAYRYGPVIGLLLRLRNSCESQVAQELLNIKKGSAFPGNQNSETIRGRHSASSRVFNLIHVPDNALMAAKEAEIWFSRASIGHALNYTKNISIESLAVADEVSVLGYNSGNCLIGNWIRIVIKARLVHAIFRRETNPDRCASGFALINLYRKTAHYVTLSNREILVDFACVEQQLLKTLLPNNNADQERFAFWILSNPKQHKEISIGALGYLWYILEKWRVYVSDIERYVLATDALYPLTIHG